MMVEMCVDVHDVLLGILTDDHRGGWVIEVVETYDVSCVCNTERLNKSLLIGSKC